MIDKQISMVFKAMIDALLGKVEDPQMMLEATYAGLQSQLLSIRQKLAQALATEAQLKREIERLKSKNAPASQLEILEKQLKQVQAELAELRRKLSDLESAVLRAYTKKQVLIARDKAGRATLVTDEILVGKAITDVGTTWDVEIAPPPGSLLSEEEARDLALQELRSQQDEQWILLAMILVTIAVIAVILLGPWVWHLLRSYF